jgi:ubiquinone/menaquinone biosynthesis C-methylase UbiE
MGTTARYAEASVWNQYFARLAAQGDDLNASGWWAPEFFPFLEQFPVTTVLDLGCGTGSDSLGLARRGLRVTGMDYSAVALERARAKAQAEDLPIEFRLGDMARPLPFPDASFGAVMSNVALHSFPDRTTRKILAEICLVVEPRGLLLLHVNSTEDMPYRAQRYTRVEEVEANVYREAHGQTMHFFSEQYCRDVLRTWTILDLTHQELRDDGGTIFKCVWRCVAQKPAPSRASRAGTSDVLTGTP